jgi:hypothetical protein
MTDLHEPENWYWEAEGDDCPHGPRPDGDVDDATWDAWWERHRSSDNGTICLDAPAGEACGSCSADHGEMVPWTQCAERTHRRPQQGITPAPDADHEQVPVWSGTAECLERECDEYFNDDGDEIPGLTHCTHVREEFACSCQRLPDGEYSTEPCPLNVPAT